MCRDTSSHPGPAGGSSAISGALSLGEGTVPSGPKGEGSLALKAAFKEGPRLRALTGPGRGRSK